MPLSSLLPQSPVPLLLISGPPILSQPLSSLSNNNKRQKRILLFHSSHSPCHRAALVPQSAAANQRIRAGPRDGATANPSSSDGAAWAAAATQQRKICNGVGAGEGRVEETTQHQRGRAAASAGGWEPCER
jgi:hypothetical protein